ncbi:conserved hypothetical protein [Microbacterium sp. C448]|uniref:hypothetical protein n=1 Tax=Microbacterium sp. C448 TaxID=1177594 RepID=UPI0003DE3E85|nr:hypothetical protein [Microbacterium sp. C448]CDK01080.1 conserved hypothetical protein [Microbacterium sp. C448]
MEPWQFFGSYWWLIFPLMGVAGGVGRAWQKALERRHKRRLEIMRAKSELRAAQVAARAQPAVTDASGSRTSDTPVARLQRLFDAHDAVTSRWLEYELDVAKLIAFPAMSDGRQPLTAAFLRAKRKADGLRPESPKARVGKDELVEYRDAVHEYEAAFDIAERDARRLRDGTFTEVERKRLDTAKQLLSVAVDQAATPAERQLAYRRVREELDGLISVSDEAIEVLENRVALELTAGEPPAAESGAVDTTDDSVPPPPPPEHPADTAEPAVAPASAPPTGSWPVPSRASTPPPGRVTRPRPHA